MHVDIPQHVDEVTMRSFGDNHFAVSISLKNETVRAFATYSMA